VNEFLIRKANDQGCSLIYLIMRSAVLFFIIVLVSFSCHNKENKNGDIIAMGQMPNLAKDKSGNAYLVYGSGDSILYSYSADEGKSFSSPSLVAMVPELAASHMRGPQIATTLNGVVVTACNTTGNIFSFTKDQSGRWSQAIRVNDVDTIAKENLMALAADGDTAFAVWLDLRDGHNRIYGAKSSDGGRSWSKNMLVYASPDSTVCECCKPSVAVKGNSVYVMFRNWLNGNRDLYLIRSTDGEGTFGPAQKLGYGSWALDGCPMDGGGLAINESGNAETVWNRKGIIYACEPGKAEEKLGEGRNCAMETVRGKNVYAWVENGTIVVRDVHGRKKSLGKGQLPQLKAINNEHVLCVWENDKQIHKTVLEL
jgi:hypothetical protein